MALHLGSPREVYQVQEDFEGAVLRAIPGVMKANPLDYNGALAPSLASI